MRRQGAHAPLLLCASVSGGGSSSRTIGCVQCSALINFGGRQNESLFPTDSSDSRSLKEIKRLDQMLVPSGVSTVLSPG